MQKSSVLIIAYNRDSLFRDVLNAVLSYDPETLYVYFDGPKEKFDELVLSTRSVLDTSSRVKWEKTKVFYSDKNRGCRFSVISAITWAFESEEFLIILEDDCLPTNTFFQFIDKARSEYQMSPDVMMISGRNPRSRYPRDKNVRFANGGIWGWATWRLNWEKFLSAPIPDSQFITSRNLRNFLIKHPSRLLRIRDGCHRVWSGVTDTWDFEWALTRVMHGGVVAIPPINLVRNIGFDYLPTHKHHNIPKVDQTPVLDISVSEILFPKFCKMDHLYLVLDDLASAGSISKFLIQEIKAYIKFFFIFLSIITPLQQDGDNHD